MLSESLQTLGGSGFLQDYPIEQYIRDARIDALYEGTTAIQSLDFLPQDHPGPRVRRWPMCPSQIHGDHRRRRAGSQV